ncbi:hypothetical protein BGX33_010856 [Mortierella sp. NVP41]|nr:hypothetical protein BGX33_010856 [Mortierella sp. NVP41]
MRQEVPDPNSPFNEASDVEDLLGYESDDLHEYPSDSDLPSYTTDIEQDHPSSPSSSPTPRYESSTVPAAESVSPSPAVASFQPEQGPVLIIPDQPIPLALVQDLTPDSHHSGQAQHIQSAPAPAHDNNQSAQAQGHHHHYHDNNNNDGSEHGDGHGDFLLVDSRDAISDVSDSVPSDSSDPQQHQEQQHEPESIVHTTDENTTTLDTSTDVVACQESRSSTSLQDQPVGQSSTTTRTVQAHAEDNQIEEGPIVPSPPSSSHSSGSASQPIVTTPRVHQLHALIDSSDLATTEPAAAADHPTLWIKITGRELTEDESNRIQEMITTNFVLQHKHQHTSGIPRPCFVTELADSEGRVAQDESAALCVYVLPASGPSQRDAQILMQFAHQTLPLLVLLSAGEYLDPFAAINLRQQLAAHLHQPIAWQTIPFLTQRVRVILRSCFTMQELLNIHIQGLINGATPVQASTFDPIFDNWPVVWQLLHEGSRVCRVWVTKLRNQLTTGVGVFFMSLTLMLAILVGTNLGTGTFSQPSHAIVRQIDYVQNGRMGVAHVDFLTAKGAPYKGKHHHPFHVRILGDDKSWSVRGAPTESVPGVADPIVQDLGNGTFKVYVAQLRKRHPRGVPRDAPLSSWLCPSKQQHFLHIWFANGTRVPLTPRELIWPKRMNLPTDRVKSEKPVDTKSPSCSGTRVGNCGGVPRSSKASSSPTYTPETTHDFDNDDDDEDTIVTWKEQLQRLSTPMVKHLSNDTVKWMSQQWGLLQPVLCDVHDLTYNALSYMLDSAKRILMLFSSWVDQLFGSQDYLATRGRTILSKAHQGAHRLKDRFFQGCSKHKGRNGTTRKEQKDLIVLLDEQLQSLKRSGQAAAEAARFPTAETILQKTDELLVEMEDQVEKLLKSKRVQAMAEHLNAEEILKKADKVLAAAEDQMEKVWKTEMAQEVNRKMAKVEEVLQTQFAQDVNRHVGDAMKSKFVKDASERIQRKVEHLAATPAGKRWVHRMERHHHHHHRQRQDAESNKRAQPWGWFQKRYQRAFSN